MFVEEIIGAFTGQNRRDRRMNFVYGTALGLLAGGVTALLLAPQSGEETREDIQQLALKGKDKAAELASLGYDKARELASQAGLRLSELREDAVCCGESMGDNLGRAKRHMERRARRMARMARHAAYEGVSTVAEKLADGAEKVGDVAEEAQENLQEVKEKADSKK